MGAQMDPRRRCRTLRPSVGFGDPLGAVGPAEQVVEGLGVAAQQGAVALGRRGGLKGGKARAAQMTPKERSESAKKAAAARWKSSESVKK